MLGGPNGTCLLPQGSTCARVPGSVGNEAELAQNSPPRKKKTISPFGSFSWSRDSCRGSTVVAAPLGAQPTQLAAASPSWAGNLHFTLEKLQLSPRCPSREPLTGTCNPRSVSKQKGSPAKGFGRRILTVSVQGEDGMKTKSKAWLSLFSSPFLSHAPKHRARSPRKVAGWTASNPARWRDDI